jgi:hypothetical protein
MAVPNDVAELFALPCCGVGLLQSEKREPKLPKIDIYDALN